MKQPNWTDIFYEEHENWDMNKYYYLYISLIKLLDFYGEPNCEELSLIDIEKMPQETKVLFYALIKNGKQDFLLDRFPNLSGLRNTKALEYSLVLQRKPKNIFPVLREYNIIV
jgi:hypothetical protein